MTDPREIEALCADADAHTVSASGRYCATCYNSWPCDPVRFATALRALAAENTRLRAALAQSKSPCAYCQLPAEEMARCRSGFPGCARADDMAGCPEFGASMEAHLLREQLAAARADTERLDWLEAQAQRGKDDETQEAFYDLSSVRLNEHTFGVWCVGGLRAAIDAAKGGA